MRLLVLLSLLLVGLASVEGRFHVPRGYGGRYYRSSAKLPDPWKRESARTGHFYDLDDPCKEIVGCSTDEMEIVVAPAPTPVHGGLWAVGGGGGWRVRGVGGGAGGSLQDIKYPPDTAMCPADECAIVPTLLQVDGEEAHEITFTKETWWYAYFAFLGATRTTKVHRSTFYSPRSRYTYCTTGGCCY